ncbi:MAG: penicillin-binding protein [Candidatus Cryptobacteroides sp.]
MAKDVNRMKDNSGGVKVWILYVLFILASCAVIVSVLMIQYGPEEPEMDIFRSSSHKTTLRPARGSIMARDGQLLAVTVPMYQISMDCRVCKEDFRSRKKADSLEQDWRNKAALLSKGLSVIYGTKSPSEWCREILRARDNNSRPIVIGGLIDHETLQKVKALPLFNEGSNKGGIIIDRKDKRKYPYGDLAVRTIGSINDKNAERGRQYIGIEGSYDYYLHGEEGFKWMKQSDGRQKIQDKDSSWTKAKDGFDVRTTLDIDYQDIADNALRDAIAENMKIEGGCAVVMEVKTGAVRAMVNLQRDSVTKRLSETYNMAVGRLGEPGSVFKTAVLMSLMEDRKVKLSTMIPTNGGRVPGFKTIDEHVYAYERQGHKQMSVLHGYEISSNYIFRKLAMDNYGDNPQKLIDNLYMYKLGEAFDFDLQGFKTPSLPSPKSGEWSVTSLGSVAIGYFVSETPLHILTLYNAIANRGRMMKPYLVESIEKDGDVRIKKGPSVLNAAVCSPDVSDSLAYALSKITQDGTAKRLKNARATVAGKTGTARIALDKKKYKVKPGDPYEDIQGRRQYQATMVGFFPADNPKYSAIVTIYSYLSDEVFYGGTLPALVFKDIVDNIYVLDDENGTRYTETGKMPKVTAKEIATSRNGKVPNLNGLSLMDAIYAIENDGYVCSYSGCGLVSSQSPAPGTPLKEGGIVTVKLN